MHHSGNEPCERVKPVIFVVGLLVRSLTLIRRLSLG
jgi:hypothetical protein